MNFSSRKNVFTSLIHGFRPNSCRRLHSSRVLSERNYYDVLNLKNNCSPREIRESFITLAKKYHPDTNPNDPKSHARFVELQKAYSVLSAPLKRSEYDLSLAGFPTDYTVYTTKKERTYANYDYKDYDHHFNEEFKEYFYRSRKYQDPNPPARVGVVQVTLLLLAFTAVGAVVQYSFLRWLYRRSYNEELEKHQRGTASVLALKEEMDKRKEEYDIRKLRLAYFKAVGHGAVGVRLVPDIIKGDLPVELEQRSFKAKEINSQIARDAQNAQNNESSSTKVKLESNTASR